MDLFNFSLWLAGTGAVAYILWDYIIKPYNLKKAGKLTRIFLYEFIGRDLVYKGMRIAEERKDSEIGSYLYIKKGKIPMQRISNEDFIQDPVYGKALQVVKHAEDDYRPIVRLKEGDWYRKEYKKVMEYETQTHPETGEEVTVEVEKLDKAGKPILNDFYVPYSQPLGITQTGREALQFALSYQKRMEERFGEKKSWIDKILPYATVVVLGMIMLMGFVQMNNKASEVQLEIAMEYGEIADNYMAEVKDTMFIEGLIKKIQREETEEGAPPK